jgi:membrane protein required for colicin V production
MLNLFDFIISSIMLTFFFSGLFKGAIRLMLGNISFMLSILMSNILFSSAKNIVDEYTQVSIIADIASASIAYIISLIVCSLMFSKLKSIIKPLCGGFIDKTCGAVLGILNGALLSIGLFIISVAIFSKHNISEHENLYLLIKAFNHDSYPKWLQASNSFYFMDNTLKTLLKIPYFDYLLQQVNFDMIFSHGQENKKSDTIGNALDEQINNLLKE